jgi:hypothetical protein
MREPRDFRFWETAVTDERHGSSGQELRQAHARALAKETGITEAQALSLVELLGIDHASLVREARVIKARDEFRGKKP